MTSIVRRATLAACLAAVALAAAAAQVRTIDKGRSARDGSAEQTSRSAAAVARAISGSARALSDFPKTRNADSVLSFYAKDYTGIENGEESSLEDERQLLSDLEERIDQGVTVGISSRAQNIRVRVAGPIAWATYDYVFKIAVADSDWDEEEGKCTSVLEKIGSAWLLKHEHCSSPCPTEDGADNDKGDEGPAQNKT